MESKSELNDEMDRRDAELAAALKAVEEDPRRKDFEPPRGA